MLILGIETSCDETAAAVVKDGTRVLSSTIASSRTDFASTGGVIPEHAARKQIEYMTPVLEQALAQADVQPHDLDAIAVTKGPGLLGSLLVGTTAARALSFIWKKPLIGVHHHLGHLSSPWLVPTTLLHFPCITLSVSGGHTELWYRTAHTKNILLGRTRDDAAGEAFDKGAALLNLPYPGGPSIAKAAAQGNPHAYTFPLPLREENTLDFSFSGLKTALKYIIRDLPSGEDLPVANLAASYQHAICTHLLNTLQKALDQYPAIQAVHIVGGVSANTKLRNLCREQHWTQSVHFPEKVYCTDNAAMIAVAGFFLIQEKDQEVYENFVSVASLSLTEIEKTR
ncbi:tRNA (adenosine(37)-N6)-threonylcarbamoyltransferase complex transferase subunit TsaD [Candidatus Peregrinibacteria bacterium CG10_big_fil_rev_8_21_14_0_10_49_16]|nr:MAG: tRNA (adenosine(37)-N6)-threonylcarbamoyltransferase complex transferase subunit TsaD [Candidatus Peregrinibacteria bacterium CG22_combo_CG10-13_8_21_14_all_49_11]PIR52366.1 MAG: tRNA (adenosine(37)-N6)-threonylcarbamoyltransferase complex transferase subunit TsaD [Candidatus Peregrinibacteria bacterium CG10_big_fil_rev_8_21_14_0_10_49_16]